MWGSLSMELIFFLLLPPPPSHGTRLRVLTRLLWFLLLLVFFCVFLLSLLHTPVCHPFLLPPPPPPPSPPHWSPCPPFPLPRPLPSCTLSYHYLRSSCSILVHDYLVSFSFPVPSSFHLPPPLLSRLAFLFLSLSSTIFSPLLFFPTPLSFFSPHLSLNLTIFSLPPNSLLLCPLPLIPFLLSAAQH